MDEKFYRIKILSGGNPLPYGFNPKRVFKRKEFAIALIDRLNRAGVRWELLEGTIQWETIDDSDYDL